MVKLYNDDCETILKLMDDNSIDAIVSDPPYGFSFMNKKWDYDVPSVKIWKECLRVLKPGGHVLAFGGPRTYHRLACNVEDAGFEIRDQIQWLFGSGFPKSLDVSKALEKIDNAAAKKWLGWGTALKPANEPIVLARKPLSESTIAKNVLKWGVGGINIDGCRIGTELVENGRAGRSNNSGGIMEAGMKAIGFAPKVGRFPANLILDEQAAFELDEQSGVLKSGEHKGLLETESKNLVYGKRKKANINAFEASSGGASRFFYCAKASKSERNSGLEGMPKRFTKTMNDGVVQRHHNESEPSAYNQNHHPTVKPIKLMEYLCKLVTPYNGTILDPFMGSGTTGIAAKNLGFNFIGIEVDSEYIQIAEKRISRVSGALNEVT